jgi:hypothetical protein
MAAGRSKPSQAAETGTLPIHYALGRSSGYASSSMPGPLARRRIVEPSGKFAVAPNHKLP